MGKHGEIHVMTNVIEEIYRTCYICGQSKYPTNIILHMPSKQGKSLTAKRFKGVSGVLHLYGDVTAQAIRKTLDELAQKDSLENIKLVIIEDYSKLKKRINIQEDFAGVIGQIASGEINVNQEAMYLSSRMSCSIIINVPNQHNKRALEKLFINAGVGNRMMFIDLKLSEKEAKRIRRMGLLKQHRYGVAQTAPFEEEYGILDDIFMDDHLDIADDNELAFLWGSLKIRDTLYEDIKTYQRKPIEQLDLGGYWDE